MRTQLRSIVPKLALAALAVGAFSGLSTGQAYAAATSCQTPAVTQPFLSWGDSSYYTLAPGMSAGNFTGTGWTLSGGARILTTRLVDGTTGHVLDLPSGASAVSPATCVTSNYPTARTMMRDMWGSSNLFFFVTYAGSGMTLPSRVGVSSSGAWNLSPKLPLFPSSAPGWQLATIRFAAGFNPSDVQLYNFYLDPYTRG